MNTGQLIKKIHAIANAEKFDREAWKKIEREAVAANICPACAQNDEPTTGRLGHWKPGNAENYAGKYCLLCEEFWKCGEQIEYCHEPDNFSDADGGL